MTTAAWKEQSSLQIYLIIHTNILFYVDIMHSLGLLGKPQHRPRNISGFSMQQSEVFADHLFSIEKSLTTKYLYYGTGFGHVGFAM